MKWRKISKLFGVAMLAACLALTGCGSKSTNTIIVTVLPGSATIVVKQQQSFIARVTGSTNTNVTWTLTISTTNCSPGCGTLDSTTNATITYTAPATIPSALVPAAGSTTTPPPLTLTAISVANSKKTGKATITLDSGIRVTQVSPATATIAAGASGITPEHLQFFASVSDNSAVTWLVTQATTVNGSAATCSPGCGSIDSSGNYTAPTSLPTTTTVTVVATSKTDTTRSASAAITLVDPTKNKIVFSSISPTIAALGGFQQDIYLNVTNLRSTISVSYNSGTAILPSSSQLKIINASVARLRLNATNLSVSSTPISVPISVQDQHGNVQSVNLQLVAVRPSVIAAVPDSFRLSAPPGSLKLDGGFFGGPGTPIVSASFGSNNLGVPTPGSRQLTANLSTSNPATAGLYPVSVTNSSATPSTATTNLAVQPDLVVSPATIKATLPLLGTAPSAIAVDSTLGLAVVTEQNSSSVQIVNLTGGTPALGTRVKSGFNKPTGVAIDDQLSTHVAAVANSGDSTLTVMQIPSGTVLGKANLGALIPATTGSTPPAAYAVGIDPFTHLALVAFSSTNIGFIVNIDPSNANPGCITGTTAPFCPISSVTLNTGAKPQIAFEPRLHLAFVTPGGAGLMSVVDLTRKSSIVPIAAASANPPGASRTSSVVTIKTTAAHNINPAVGGTVLISGVTPSDFNGSFQVGNVIDAFTFQYAQTAADEKGGGGSVSFGNPDFTFSISNTNQGIAINPETRTAIVADPNASIGQISFISTLDEGVTSLTLNVGSFLTTTGSAPELGAQWVAFQPFTNVAVSFNPGRNEVSFIDPSKPQRLALAFATGQTGCAPAACGTGAITGALAVDPATNLALVANSGSNSLTAISIGDTTKLKPVHISQVQLLNTGGTLYQIPGAVLPQAVLSSKSTLPPGIPVPALGTVKIFGTGLDNTSIVRLDGVSVVTQGGTVTPVGIGGTELDVTIPTSFLATPRHFALDVMNSAGVGSNAADLTVLQTINVSGGCSGTSTPQPGAVAIDEERNIAVVANSGCNDVSIIDLTPGATTPVIKSVAVGKSPADIAVIPRLGFAVVTNNGAGTASILDISNPASAKEATSDVTVGASPLGVAINQDTGAAVIANNGSNSVSLIDLTVLKQSPAGTPKAVNAAVDQLPIAVAIDPDRGTNAHGLAVVTAIQQSGISSPTGVLDVVDIGTGSPVKNANATFAFLTATPTGIVFDPAVSPGLFYITSSEGNVIDAFNPDTGQVQQIRVGINPTSIAYNLQTGTILTVNTASNTISVIDSQTFQTRGTFGISGSSQFAAAIHSRTNMAVIADQANNRVILYPLPK